MPPLPKPANRRQGRHRKDFGVIEGGRREVPVMPKGLRRKVTAAWWEAAWGSDIAVLWSPADVPMVERLASLIDQRDRAQAGLQGSELVTGSQGQPVLNPLAKLVGQCDTEIRQLEDRLGLSPRSRLQLGATMGQAHQSLSSLVDDDESPVIDLVDDASTG